MAELRFDEADAQRAYDEWGANCGPGAIAAVLDLTLDEVRPHLVGFSSKQYTNPTMMWAALNALGASWRLVGKDHPIPGHRSWPKYGLARVQWEGPWTRPGVPPRVAYGHTHWIGVNARNPSNIGIFDINCISAGGWISQADWASILVPWLLKECEPGADGGWHLTHAVEIAAALRPEDRGQ